MRNNLGNTVETSLYVVSFFLITLQSFYFPYVGSFLTYIGVVIFGGLFLSRREAEIDRRSLVYFGGAMVIIAVCATPMVIRGVDVTDFRSFLAFSVMLIFVPIIRILIRENERKVVFSLKFVIAIHCLALIMQVIYWINSKEYFDILATIGVDTSGSISKKGIMAFGIRVPRFSGLFNEPGSFSVTIMSLLVAAYAYRRQLDLIIMLGIAATLCTMSLYGILLIIMFLAFVVIDYGKIDLKKLSLLVLLAMAFLYVGGGDAILLRLSSSYSGFSFRTDMINDLASSIENMTLGLSNSDYPAYMVPNDIGVWFAMWVSFGCASFIILGSIVFFVFRETRSIVAVLMVLIIIITKLKFTYPIFWVLIACTASLFEGKNGKNKIIDT